MRAMYGGLVPRHLFSPRPPAGLARAHDALGAGDLATITAGIVSAVRQVHG